MGMGLQEWLKKSEADSGSRGGNIWLPSWNDKGSIVVWMHLAEAALPQSYYVHSFIFEDEIEEKDDSGEKTGKSKRILRFPKFVSPDPTDVLKDQFFREDKTGQMKRQPVRDPFLLLREWLRLQGRTNALSLDQVVFEWTDHKNRGALIQWRLGEISGLVKRGQQSFNHSLDAKFETMFCFVDDAKLGDGPRLARAGKLLRDKIIEEIKKQTDARGDEEGDPTRSPYALKLVYQKNEKNMNNIYSAYRYDKAAYTDEVYAAITGEHPDMSQHVRAGEDDMTKIQAAFAAAAQIELPLEAIFSDDPAQRAALLLPSRAAQTSPRAPASAPRPPAAPGAAKPPPRAPAPAATNGAAAPATAAPASTGGRRRVKQAAPPPPPSEPEVELLPCESCGKQISANAAKCDGCGAEYEIDDAQPATPPPPPVPTKAPAKPKTAAAPKPAPAAAAPKPTAKASDTCWACGSQSIETDDDANRRCTDCGVDQARDGSDLPF